MEEKNYEVFKERKNNKNSLIIGIKCEIEIVYILN